MPVEAYPIARLFEVSLVDNVIHLVLRTQPQELGCYAQHPRVDPELRKGSIVQPTPSHMPDCEGIAVPT